MESVSSLTGVQIYENEDVKPIMDTTFVLFFLALDMGQNLVRIGFDTMFMVIALLAVAILPYFLATSENESFGKWLLGRSTIVGFAILLGVLFKQSLGVVFPEAFSFLPFTFLIVTAMLSCYIQFYSFFKFRLSK